MLLLVLETLLPRMAAVLVGGERRAVLSASKDSSRETNFPKMRQQEPVVVERAPLACRHASLRIEPISLDSRDVASGPLLEDVVNSQHFVLFKFTTELNLPQVLHGLIVVARVLTSLGGRRPQVTDQIGRAHV